MPLTMLSKGGPSRLPSVTYTSPLSPRAAYATFPSELNQGLETPWKFGSRFRGPIAAASVGAPRSIVQDPGSPLPSYDVPDCPSSTIVPCVLCFLNPPCTPVPA